jgi:hypothetical protein
MRTFFDADSASVTFFIHEHVMFRITRNVQAHAVFNAFGAGNIGCFFNRSLRAYRDASSAVRALIGVNNGTSGRMSGFQNEFRKKISDLIIYRV